MHGSVLQYWKPYYLNFWSLLIIRGGALLAYVLFAHTNTKIEENATNYIYFIARAKRPYILKISVEGGGRIFTKPYKMFSKVGPT